MLARRATTVAQGRGRFQGPGKSPAGGTEELIGRIDKDQGTGLDQALIHLHEALHRRQARHSGEPDVFGEL